MKKFIIILALGCALFACSRKTIVSTDTRTPAATIENQNAGREEKPLVEEKPLQPLPLKTETVAVPAEPLAVGKHIYTTRCNRCHELRSVEAYNLPQWENILKAMAPRARLNAEELKQVREYIATNAKK